MKTAHNIFKLLLIFVAASSSHGQNNGKDSWNNYPKDISLKFEKIVGDPKTSFTLDFHVSSFVPLKIDSDKVTVSTVKTGKGTEYEGIRLNDVVDYGKFAKIPYYVFNSATQCFEYGYLVIINGQGFWTAGTASEQIAHNICAPRGQFYCRPNN